MTAVLTFATKRKVALDLVRSALREQLERSILIGLIGTDAPDAVAGELLETLCRPSLADALQIVALREQRGPEGAD